MDAPDNSQQATSAPSLNAALAEEFDKMEGQDTAEETEVQTGTADADTEIREEELSETIEAVAEASTQTDEEEIEGVEAASEWNEPAPERWPEDLKKVYMDLPPAAQQAMLDGIYKPMQRQYTETTRELAGKMKQIAPLLESMDQNRNLFERNGQDPMTAVKTQMAWAAHFAQVGPQQGLQDMQAAYGMTQKPAGQEVEDYLTPAERTMKADLHALQQQVGLTSQNQQQFQEQQNTNRQNAHEQGVRNELQSFITEQKDGKPAYPHVEKVAPAIAGLIRGGLVAKQDDYGQPIPIGNQFRQAYKMACDLDPSIRSARSQPQQVTAARAVQDASVVAKTPAGESTVPQLTLAEELEQRYDKLDRRTG